jgi:prepilin-type N-terminal cleavage/methylation domain-containing protein
MHRPSPFIHSSKQRNHKNEWRPGFTIVELLIVIVVIAILAAISIVAYNGIQNRAIESTLKGDLTTAAKKIGLVHVDAGSYPATSPTDLPSTIQYSQTNSGQGYCATASKNGKAFHITQNNTIQPGACSGHTIAGNNGGGSGGGGTEIAANSPIQNVTQAQCQALPVFTGSNNTAVRTVTDNRGGTTRTYEIAKLADGKCWMLTNLKLGSTTGPITLAPADSNVGSNFVLPQLVTSGATSDDSPRPIGPVPGDSGSGTTNYGYLYNFSAATAGETRTSLTTGNAAHSICPANWRLPTAGVYGVSGGWPYSLITPGDFSGLDIAFGGTGSFVESGEANIAKWQPSGPFRGSFSGLWSDTFDYQGGTGNLWSASAFPGYPVYAFVARFDPDGVSPGDGNGSRHRGFGVRCLLN